jgi:RHS repeat-associated protein
VGSPTKEYIYAGSTLLATLAGSTTSYHHADHLSVRLTTDSSGNSLGQQGHYPFGEQWYPVPPQAPATKWQFTSYERDGGTNESSNDYAMARYHVNRLGRSNAPDPMAGSVLDPQSLNRYAYVRNDPGNLVDPLGLVPQHIIYLDCDFVDTFARNIPALEGTAFFDVWLCTLRDIGFRSVDDQDRPPGPDKTKPDCRAQMRSRPGDITNPLTHAWWYLTDAKGQDYTVSFSVNVGQTPTGFEFFLNAYVTKGSQSSSNKNDNLKHGKEIFDSGWSPENCDKVAAMLNAAKNFPQYQVPYIPITSNSGARYLSKVGGFSPPQPPMSGGVGGWNVLIPGVEH